jgi:hypothetical protein
MGQACDLELCSISHIEGGTQRLSAACKNMPDRVSSKPPSPAKRLATPNPVPALPPVTTAILLSSFLFINPFICDQSSRTVSVVGLSLGPAKSTFRRKTGKGKGSIKTLHDPSSSWLFAYFRRYCDEILLHHRRQNKYIACLYR